MGGVCVCQDDGKSSVVEDAELDKPMDGGVPDLSKVGAVELDVTIRKQGPDEKLGMDVKHLVDRLEVTKIFPDFAVNRANQASPKTALRVGDVIVQVNSTHGNDARMVAEIRLNSELKFKIRRSIGGS
mmetsp:Transcript_39163/g.77529  ORF Transcript_39163/g.77529 Transcript_39163/m.77529 type:complete len:128 (+) Transcript_39163:47-430(+)|eukprot:CAMPEP_0172694864 /NCGR_PEP_ID=MMETSP1074-20121228/26961_1 /TAXON_ID=2916 /ORGANISM="Ceratium fusus, Strain PA161109" /LENGTH=127 /DNA_ID=CAMNT_0013515413 /DNA_START=57 /DNA_END=440 /DNA_ORIENTATION=-